MALAVDKFEFLAKEVFSLFASFRDALAILGAAYAAKRGVAVCWRVCKALKAHGLSRLSRQSLVTRYGPWAVVTGSTHGIGKAFAQELASHGVNVVIVSLGQEECERVAKALVVTGCTGGIGLAYTKELAEAGINLVLISRNPDKLTQLASQLEKTFGVQTHVIPVDFNEGRSVYEKIQTGLEGKDIGILVNNVGVMYDYPQYFLDVPTEKLWQLVHVNVAAATMMTHMVLPGMVDRGRGAVVTVASGASALPTPQMTVYSATKAYLDYFMRALNYEYKSKGITLQCLQPFYVATRMTGYSSTLSNPSLLIPTATTYARNALHTLGWSDRTCGYWPHTLQFWLAALIPEWLWLWGASRLNAALRRQALQRSRHRSGSRPIHSSSSMDFFLASPAASPRGSLSQPRRPSSDKSTQHSTPLTSNT